MRKPVIISIGDPSGIGPEISLKAVHILNRQMPHIPFVLAGDAQVIERVRKATGLDMRYCMWHPGEEIRRGNFGLVSPDIIKSGDFPVGAPNRICGQASYAYLKIAWETMSAGHACALVTAPISKTAWRLEGIDYTGHTEALQALSGDRVEMLMVAGRIMAVLVTTHIPLCEIWKVLSVQRIADATILACRFLQRHGCAVEPICVCALNPHAGESGSMGREEIEIIAPAVRAINEAGFRAEGPIPADSAFRIAAQGIYKLVVSLYHDQALIPLKMSSFQNLVNVSANSGAWIRTSPGHGTAFDIAYTGKADSSSMVEAIKVGLRLSGAA